MKHKTYWDLYLITRNYTGKQLLKTYDVINIFGYAQGTNIKKTKAYLFINMYRYKHPCFYWVLKDNYVAVLYEDLPEYEKKYRNDCREAWNEKRDSQHFSFKDSYNKTRFLIDEENIPFWKLAKYGGYIV